MRTDEDIIREYMNADRARRLNLYLQYRGLRSTFYRVDVKERHVSGEKIVETLPPDGEISGDRLRTRWRRFLPHLKYTHRKRTFLPQKGDAL